jgi:hypothetical protein
VVVILKKEQIEKIFFDVVILNAFLKENIHIYQNSNQILINTRQLVYGSLVMIY